MRSDLHDLPMHCVVCQKVIPEDRDKRKATTCSPECLTIRKQALRNRMDLKRCRYCLRPSTPQDRAQFNRWRKQQGQTAALEMFRAMIELAPAEIDGLKFDRKAMTKLLDTLQEPSEPEQRGAQRAPQAGIEGD